MTQDEFTNFLEKFKAINSFAGKIKYADMYLTRIGMGSGRAVYAIDDTRVLKVARNTKGVAQNEIESNIGYYQDTHHIVTEVFDSADDESWLISEKGKKVNEKRIIQLTGIPSLSDLYMYLRNFTEQNNGRKKMFGQSEEIVHLLNENEFAQDLDNFIANYNQSAGDMGRPSTYGEVLRDGQPSIVLTDYGLNDEVYSTHYDPQRKSKQSYRMYELYNFADGNDDILSDAGGEMDIKQSMWAQIPYGVGDGDGMINEEFVHFVSNRDYYPERPLPSMPYLVEGFHDCVNNLEEILSKHKDKRGFYKNLLILQDYLIEQNFYDRDPLGKMINEFGGEALYTTAHNVSGDGFPTYNTDDSSPSIENDLNVNSAMYEDLDYNHASDATQDEYVIDERVVSSMAGSSSVEVKDKCRLGGSSTCNQGDISNLNIKPLKEAIDLDSPISGEGWKSYKIMNDGEVVGEMELTAYHNHKNYIQLGKIFINKEHRFQGFANDAMNILIAYADTNKKIIVLTPDNVWGASKEKLKKWYKTFGFVQNSGKYTDFTTRESMYRLPKGVKFGQQIDEEYLGVVDYLDDEKKQPIEIFKNPKSLKRLNPSIRGIIDSKTGDLYVANVVDYMHYLLIGWLNQHQNTKFPTSYTAIYSTPEVLVPVQRDRDTDVFKLGELYPAKFDGIEERENMLAKIENVLELAKIKNPTIEFIPQMIDSIEMRPKLSEEIDASEAYRDEDGLQTIFDGKRNIAGFVTYNRKDVIKKLEDIGLNILPLTGNPHGLVIVFNDRGRENAMKLWKYATSKGGYFQDETPEEARFIGKMLQYTDDSVERFVNRIYDENGKRRKNIYEAVKQQQINFTDDQILNTFLNKLNQKSPISRHPFIAHDLVYGDKGLLSFSRFSKGDRNEIDLESIMAFEKQKGLGSSMMQDIIDVADEMGVKLTLIAKPFGQNQMDVFDLINFYKKFGFQPDLSVFDGEFSDERQYLKYIKQYPDEGMDMYRNPRNSNISENDVVGMENSSTFAGKFPVTNTTESMEENDVNEEKAAADNNWKTEKNYAQQLDEVELMSLNDLPFKQDVEAIGGKIYSVGGAVRDKFLGMDSKDLDILITGVPFEELEKIVSKYGRVDAVGKSFGVLKFMPNGMELDEPIDIAIPRTETPTGGGGHKDFDIKSDHALPLEKDLERRDFTINAIGKDIEGNVYDPYHGQEDLKNKIIRAANPQAFKDDPLRMLRAVQFACRFKFTIEPTTWKMIQDNAEMIKKEPAERLITEFDKIIRKGDIRLGVQLLKDSGLFLQIFGFDIKQSTIDRSPFEEVRTMGEFLFLLTRLLPDPAKFYLQRFASKDTKKDNYFSEIKALNTGLEIETDNPVALRSIAHNMYLISPASLSSKILPEALQTAAQELLSGKYPKTNEDLAVNGNDMQEYTGKSKGQWIGDAKKMMLLKIYSDKVSNTKEDLLALLKNSTSVEEGVGDKYVERKFGIPDTNAGFEKKYNRERLIGTEIKPVAYVKGFDPNTNTIGESPIYKNPKSLTGFDRSARAISTESGDLYVALNNYGFTHGDMSVALGFFKDNMNIFYAYDKFATYHRINYMDAFGISATNEQYLKKGNEEIVQHLIEMAGQKNPQYDFTTDFMEYISKAGGVEEGVGDKYVERKFGIPDTNAEFEKKYNQHISVPEKPIGFVSDFNKEEVPVYLNPKSLANFDAEVRAIGDSDGNLYVVQHDGSFSHGQIAKSLGLFNDKWELYQALDQYVTLHRIGNTNKFGLAGSTNTNARNNGLMDLVNWILENLKKKNPQFNFTNNFYGELLNKETIKEDMGRVLYSAIVLDKQSKQKLVKVFKPMIPKDWEILAHHMTLNMGGIDPKYKRDLGRDIELSVVDYAMDDKVMAVGVEGYATNNKKAHITIAVNRANGGKPVMSNNLTDWRPIEFPLQIDGIVTEVKP